MRPLSGILAFLVLLAGGIPASGQPISPAVGPAATNQPAVAAPDTSPVDGRVPGVPGGTLRTPASWSEPTAPFHIVGNIHYVGSAGLAAYLITSPSGSILLDGTLVENVPQIEHNIPALGFRLRDVKILLNSHAHYDHAGGLQQLKRDTGAILLASAGDRPALESGIPPSDTSYGVVTFPPVKVDRVLVDGEPIRLGDITLTPWMTPGHTPGCTSFGMTVKERGRLLHVIFPGSLTVAGNRLIGNKGYPGIAGNLRRSIRRVGRMQADVVLPAHPELADVLGRARQAAVGTRDAFLMPGVLARIVDDSEKAFDAELAKETTAAMH